MQCDSVVLPTTACWCNTDRQGLCWECRVEVSKPSYAQLIILLIPAAFLVAYLGACSLARLVDLELPLWLKICWSYYVVVALNGTTMALVGTLWLKVPIERMKLGSG